MMDTLFDEDFNEVTRDELARGAPEEQKEIMEIWFRQNYEHPAEHTPFESREGGYIWIWGGPYDAREELQWKFGEVVDEEVINELAEELGRESWEWAPTLSSLDEDDFVDVLAASQPYRVFEERMEDLEALASVDYPSDSEQAQYQLLSAAGVSALEAYLVERAVRGIRQSDAALRSLVEKHPKFKERKTPVAEVFKLRDSMEDYVSNFLAGMVWHRLGRVRRVFQHAFDLSDFPETAELEEVISIRHDIVHRAGRDAGGERVEIDPDELERQFGIIRDFVGELELLLPLDEDGEMALRHGDGPPVTF